MHTWILYEFEFRSRDEIFLGKSPRCDWICFANQTHLIGIIAFDGNPPVKTTDCRPFLRIFRGLILICNPWDCFDYLFFSLCVFVILTLCCFVIVASSFGQSDFQYMATLKKDRLVYYKFGTICMANNSNVMIRIHCNINEIVKFIALYICELYVHVNCISPYWPSTTSLFLKKTAQ